MFDLCQKLKAALILESTVYYQNNNTAQQKAANELLKRTSHLFEWQHVK